MYIILEISYNGLFFDNLTHQKTHQKTLQSYIEHCIESTCIEATKIHFMSRTDRHVSAEQQFVSIKYSQIILDKIKQIANKIYIKTKNNARLHSAYVTQKLPPRCKEKIYKYKIHTIEQTNHNKNRMYIKYEHIKNIYNYISKINNSTINYQYICKAYKKNTRPTVAKLYMTIEKVFSKPQHQNKYDIYVYGRCFLYRQIRILIGTLIKASEKNIPISNILQWLESSKVIKGSVPGEYLTLIKINLDKSEWKAIY